MAVDRCGIDRLRAGSRAQRPAPVSLDDELHMTTFFAINGLGRIGRALLRVARQRPDLQLVAINDPAPTASLARLIAHDTVHGRYAGSVTPAEGGLQIDGRFVPVTHQEHPPEIPWPKTARLVIEASGQATTRALAAGHLRRGAEKVLITAIADDVDLMVCLGINQDDYRHGDHHVLSNASCTTNCLALLLAVLDRSFGVRQGMMNEVHSYTSDQRLVDGPHRDPRRGRSAAANIVPTSSRAAQAVEQLMPQLRGRLAAQAIRVPTPNMALLELVVQLHNPATEDSLNEALRQAAAGPLRGLLSVNEDPLVSSDHIGDPHSAIVDALSTQKAGDGLFRILAWYDNEWGYANRLADLSILIGEQLP